ncbi:MAG: hypothetical protein FWC41_06485 [Firmicutes bacterium]|nr:hypothetical protein [Bacillota bacterium]
MKLKTIIIQSIGTANPSIGSMLSRALDITPQIISRFLYCTPSVLFKEVDEAMAQKIEKILTQFGLVVKIQDVDEPLPENPQLFELAIYIDDVRRLPEINKTLSEFLGCSEQEALNLLLTDPGIVLGGVSFSTAEALKNRINAEVLISNPQTDLYTLIITGDDNNLKNDTAQVLKSASIQINSNQKVFENIDYKTSQLIWSRFQQTGKIQIINQSFQRFEILLHEFNIENPKQKNCLLNVVGMPENILHVLSDNLPVILDESVDIKMLIDKVEIYNNAGLKCTYQPLLFQNYKIIINEITDREKTAEVVKLFFPEEKNMKIKEKWMSPKTTNHLLTRYIVQLLEDVGCNIEIQKVA